MRGRWSGTLPGVPKLAEELGVDRKTVWAATLLLEQEGLLQGQGAGRPRKIVPSPDGASNRALRVAILEYNPAAFAVDYMIELEHQLSEAGHTPIRAPKTLMELQMDVKRIARTVGEVTAEAWIVSAASREVLEWFASQEVPTMALFGRRRGLPVAGVGPDKPPTTAAVARRLVALGHRRIAMLTGRARRHPRPGASEQAFLDELEAHGLVTGAYNLPDWEESGEGFKAGLEALFAATPPTALLLDEPHLFHAAYHHLAQRGLRVPQDVSLICTDDDLGFAWCQPTVAHIRWDPAPVVRRILQWADNVARGREDLRQSATKAEFVEGGTIGPAPQEGAPPNWQV
mgnify:CR=1 FL=1